MISNLTNRGNEFKKIILRDIYCVRKWKDSSFDFIFDIGANLGIFSVFMKMRHPNAKVIAVEASIEVCNYLRQNINMLNICLEEMALGDGEPLFFKYQGHVLDAIFSKDEVGYKVNSITLEDLFKKHQVDILTHKYFLKFNCEGGEKYLIGDPEAEKILVNAAQIGIQLHFNTENVPQSDWITLEEYDEWIKRIFVNHYVKKYRVGNKEGTIQYLIKKL